MFYCQSKMLQRSIYSALTEPFCLKHLLVYICVKQKTFIFFGRMMGRRALHQTFELKGMLEFDCQERRKLFDFNIDRICILHILLPKAIH